MRLTGHEIMLIAVIASALIVGALAKCYRNTHSTGNPQPESTSAETVAPARTPAR
jgi:hypothetical protein